jgi:hypothetical protein
LGRETSGTGLKSLPLKAGAIKRALKDDKVVIVRERSTGNAFEVTKVKDQHVVVREGSTTDAPKERLKMSEFKQRFDDPVVSRGGRGDFPEN